jgi:hypothetical protein
VAISGKLGEGKLWKYETHPCYLRIYKGQLSYMSCGAGGGWDGQNWKFKWSFSKPNNDRNINVNCMEKSSPDRREPGVLYIKNPERNHFLVISTHAWHEGVLFHFDWMCPNQASEISIRYLPWFFTPDQEIYSRGSPRPLS